MLSSWQPDTLCCRECFTKKPLVQFINVHDLGTVLNLEYYNTDTPTKFGFHGAEVQRVLLWSYKFVSGTAYTLWMIFHVIGCFTPYVPDLRYTHVSYSFIEQSDKLWT